MSNLNMDKIFKRMDKEYQGSNEILGKSSMTFPNHMNSSRTIMISGQLDQFEVLTKPDVPLVLTNAENLAGEFSTGYYKTDAQLKVMHKIIKFDMDEVDIEDSPYLLIVYNYDEDMFDVIEKKPCENLTESYGYAYNTDVIDSKEVGDRIPKGEVLYKSTSYDEFNNYGYGVNALTVLLIDVRTTEDAIVISESLRDKLESVKVIPVRVPLNDNDIFINAYGKNKYQSFPNIGQKIKDHIVASVRRINYTQILYDLSTDELNKYNNNDTNYYTGIGQSDAILVDMNIYCNKEIEEFDDTDYNKQFLQYYKNQIRYNEQIVKIVGELKENGANLSDDLNFIYKRALDSLNPEKKWRDGDGSIFSNMIVEFIVKKKNNVEIGSKISGRYGDKGIISEIVPDDQMPYVEELGARVEMIKNELAVYNRLISFPKYEIEINFFSKNVRMLMEKELDYEKKADLMFDFINDINPKQAKHMRKIYSSLDPESRESLVLSAQDNGIHLHIPPFWNYINIDTICRLYDKWKFEKYHLTLNKFGRKINMINTAVVGEQYIIKLKHTAENKLSARSTAQLNTRDLPYKSDATKNNKSLINNTPVKRGEMELQNLMISNDMDFVKSLDFTLSSSIKARRNISFLYEGNVLDYEGIPIDDECKNRNVEILKAKLFSMGLKLNFYNKETGEELEEDF